MKTIIIYLLVIISTSLINGQSSIVYDAGTSIDIGANADICANTITVNGTFTGNGTFCSKPTDVETEDIKHIPTVFSLSQNYPNPFNPITTIRYDLPEESKVEIKIYNILGEEMIDLLNEVKEAGIYEVEFNSESLPSGTYFYRINAGNFVQTKKMILLK